MCGGGGRETDRQTQTQRERDRQADRQTLRQADRERERERGGIHARTVYSPLQLWHTKIITNLRGKEDTLYIVPC